jgi:hypothetical protein
LTRPSCASSQMRWYLHCAGQVLFDTSLSMARPNALHAKEVRYFTQIFHLDEEGQLSLPLPLPPHVEEQPRLHARVRATHLQKTTSAHLPQMCSKRENMLVTTSGGANMTHEHPLNTSSLVSRRCFLTSCPCLDDKHRSARLPRMRPKRENMLVTTNGVARSVGEHSLIRGTHTMMRSLRGWDSPSHTLQ